MSTKEDSHFRELIGRQVLSGHNKRSYGIDEIRFDMNPQSTFECKGKLLTLTDYYKERYNIEILDKDQPLLVHRYNCYYTQSSQEI